MFMLRAHQEEVASLQRGLEAANAQLQQLQQNNTALDQVCCMCA